MSAEDEKRLVAEFKAFTKGETIASFPITADNNDTVSIERRIAKKKGSWWQLPKDLHITEEGE